MPIDPVLPPPLLEVSHVAHRLRYSEPFVRQLIRQRKIPAIRFGTRWRVDPVDLEAFIDAQRVASGVDDRRREQAARSFPEAVTR